MSGQIDSGTRERIAKLLGLLGSAFDGEALAAARKAEELRCASGLSWSELLTGQDQGVAIATEAARTLLFENEELRAEIARLREAISNPRMPQPWREAQTYEDGAQSCLIWAEHLTGWETGFLQSLLRQRKRLTSKQITVLGTIGEKVDRAIRAAWRYRGRAA